MTTILVATESTVIAIDAERGTLTPSAGVGNGNQSQGFPDGTNARRAQLSFRVVF